MDFTNFDLIISGLILFLSIKGMVNGFSKELLNSIGLIGGVAVASRMNMVVGEFISNNIFVISKEPAIKFVGFIAIFLMIWLVFNIVSSIIDSLSSDETGFVSGLLGYILSVVRYIALFAIIVVISQNEFLEKKLSKYYESSIIFPHLVEIGSQILYTDERVSDANSTASAKQENNISLREYSFENNNPKE